MLHLSSCVKCLKCVQACPTSALRMENDRIHVHQEKCINCGRCIKACHSKGLLAQGSTLEDIASYDYTVCMVPSSIISDCASLEEAGELLGSIKQMGFDEVVDLSDIEGQVLEETQLFADQQKGMSWVASFCPVIRRFIEINYPMLLEHIVPIQYPHEIAAKQIRTRLKDKGNVGIFHCCECESKLALAKFPYGNPTYETDHALAMVDLFPKIQHLSKKESIPVCLCREGLQACNPSHIVQKENYLIADGFDKICNILDLAEFDLLKGFDLLMLYPCFNGCIGGHLLWGNSYILQNHIDALTSQKRKPIAQVPFEELYSNEEVEQNESGETFLEKMQFFTSVNDQLEQLPGYDCSACGCQTCRIMAEEIVKGKKSLNDCKILGREKEKNHATENID